jgi:large subunit ribosomal protein L21
MAEAKTLKKKAPAKKPVAKKAPAPTSKKEGSEYAVIATGGKQYRVSPGVSIKIEKMVGKFKEGDKIVFDKVLLVDDGADSATIGAPYINGAEVTGTLKKIGRYKTIDVIKYKQKSRYFKKNGHRQPFFEVEIDAIK